jgi:hypothetical protein
MVGLGAVEPGVQQVEHDPGWPQRRPPLAELVVRVPVQRHGVGDVGRVGGGQSGGQAGLAGAGRGGAGWGGSVYTASSSPLQRAQRLTDRQCPGQGPGSKICTC